MEKFFESAINLVKSDEGIVLIVLIVAIMIATILMSKRKKVKNSFSGNTSDTKIDVDAQNSKDGIVIENSGNDNRNSEINIKL